MDQWHSPITDRAMLLLSSDGRGFLFNQSLRCRPATLRRSRVSGRRAWKYRRLALPSHDRLPPQHDDGSGSVKIAETRPKKRKSHRTPIYDADQGTSEPDQTHRMCKSEPRLSGKDRMNAGWLNLLDQFGLRDVVVREARKF